MRLYSQAHAYPMTHDMPTTMTNVTRDPTRLAEAQLVRPAQLLQIPLVPVEERPLGRVRGHREEPIVHDESPYRAAAGGSGR